MTTVVSTDPPAPSGTDAPRRWRWIALGVGAAVVAVVVVLPTRTWVEQRAALRSSQSELEEIERSNRDLAAKIDRLSQDESIERQAREQFGLVYPGEEPYTVLPPGPPTVNLPRVWPFEALQEPLARAAARDTLRDR